MREVPVFACQPRSGSVGQPRVAAIAATLGYLIQPLRGNSFPVATAWGSLLLAHAFYDCWEAGRTFAFVVVVLDCTNDAAKAIHSSMIDRGAHRAE
jgi:hypothetical protein